VNIFVCLKQVSSTTKSKLNKEANTLIREGINSIINPFDLYALEEALRIREKMGRGKITTISMGLPFVSELLKNTLALGVDHAVLLSDKSFAGADTLATAYTLSMGIRRAGKFDLIICGRQAVDGDTAQVGPSLAEKLGIQCTTNVRKVEEITDKSIKVQRLTEYGFDVVEMKIPALITVVKDINKPRTPTLKGITKAKKAFVQVWTASDIGADINRCGLQGSPTKVIKAFNPGNDVECEMLEGSPREQAKELFKKLMYSENGILDRCKKINTNVTGD